MGDDIRLSKKKSRRSMLKFFGLTPLAVLSTTLVDQPAKASLQPDIVSSSGNTFNVHTTPLLANSTDIVGPLDCTSSDELGVNVYTEQPGTLNVETSVDSTKWRLVDVVSVVGFVPINRIYAVTAQYMRLRYVNGGTIQTVFELGATQR
jgi:hypothetical protein